MNVFAYVDRRSLTYNDVFSIVRGIEEYNTLIQLVRNNTQEMRSSRHAQRTVQSMLTLWNSARLFNSLSKMKATSIRNSELWADKVCRYYCIVTFALSMYSQSVNIWFRFHFAASRTRLRRNLLTSHNPSGAIDSNTTKSVSFIKLLHSLAFEWAKSAVAITKHFIGMSIFFI